ncbi:MAG: hypothetical protein EON60_12305 [Alphaproteobacteria bacterium]|nr:MAG: hypothetical protein EON60_12305 [Alphaproteobacteria bacterium]
MADFNFIDYLIVGGYILGKIPFMADLYYLLALAAPPLVMVWAFRSGNARRRQMEDHLNRAPNPSWGLMMGVLLQPLVHTLVRVLWVVLAAVIVLLWMDLYHNDGYVRYGWATSGWLIASLIDQFQLGFLVMARPDVWHAVVDLIRLDYGYGMWICDPLHLPVLALMWATRWAVVALNLQVVYAVGLLIVRMMRMWWLTPPTQTA